MPSTTDELVAGRYALQSQLGRGAMGTVWLAQDSLLKRKVAVKEIDIPPGFDGEQRDAVEARLLREARAAARLSHPGVVNVYDVVEHAERPWIVMEYIDAPTLEEAIQQSGPLSPSEAARVGLELLAVLEVAHAEGIVHRDVKPGNVMCPDDGHVKLADFGIASVQDDPKITQTGLVLGSPSFMAPEQASKGTSGPEGDLWSLGATLYQAVEGVPPFDRGAAVATLTAVMGDEPRAMERAGELEPAIHALLQKEPAERASIAKARAMLENVLEPAGARPARVTEPAPVRRQVDTRERTNWWPWLALALGIAAIIAIPLMMQGDDTPERQEQRKEQANSQDPATEDGEEGTDADQAAVPNDWTTYTDPGSGYSIDYPSSWSPIDRGENTIDFTDPETGSYLRVAWTDEPGDDVMERLREIESSFASEHAAYSQIQMTETEFVDSPAGLWEYTYEDGRAALHAYNLQFVVDDSYGFALNLQTHEEAWEGSQELWESLKATFEPPG